VSVAKKIHPTCSRIVELLRQERERQKLSKYALAQRSGISQSMIGRIESGARIPTLDTLLHLVDALKVDLSDLVKRANNAR